MGGKAGGIGGLRRARAKSALALSVATAAALLVTTMPEAPAASPNAPAFAAPLRIPPTLTGPDVTLVAQQAEVPILPGRPTTMWTFNGSFPGPVIRRPTGQPTRVTVVNSLPPAVGELTLHHHGAHVPAVDDGMPMDELIPTGGRKTYTYPMVEDGLPERGAVQWYHDHRMDVTGRNVWMGLAGMFILDDPNEAAVDAALPNGEFDVPLMVADRAFDGENQIPYTYSGDGVVGDVPLVNGVAQPYFEVAARRYRLRLLNASNVRSYSFVLNNGAGFVQVGSESGLLPAPVTRSSVVLGPAERADLVVDFTGQQGKDIVLRNQAASGRMSQIMQFRVRRDAADPSFVPATLRPARQHDLAPAAVERTWVLGRDVASGMWTINGKGFEHHRVDAAPELGKVERWTFVNTTTSDHIVHIHDVDWKVVARMSRLPAVVDVDEAGAKESFRIETNEVVVVESTFTDYAGRFVWHCHILEHEDYSMMTQFEVVPSTTPGGAHAPHAHSSHAHSHP